MRDNKERCLAVLIDAENVPAKKIKEIMVEIATYGTPTVKRIYGDWTDSSVKGWKQVLLENAITPVQQYSYTTGKNSSDSAMIIDAMDILYTEKVQGFVIVSSDSDFTRLATRLRESGVVVYGIGERKTPSAFRAACDKFTYIEVLSNNNNNNHEQVKNNTHKEADRVYKPQEIPDEIVKLIANSISAVEGDDGWAFLAEVGNLMSKKQPDFDPRNYGFYKLTPLVKSITQFEIEERETGRSTIKHIYVRNRK
ncbi:MAG: NYN domain-containing protein [Peptococcia bacterium]